MKKRDIDFLFEIGRMRFNERSWSRFFNTSVANDSEHIFRVVWLALLISRMEKKGDEEKIMKMALSHDIGESRTGDSDYLSRQYLEQKEDQAIEDILVDTHFEKDFNKLWKEADEKKSIEARIVKDADNLDIDFELEEQRESNKSLVDYKTKKRKQQLFPRLFTKSAKKLWMEIHETDPHNWHKEARNRFNSGDWKNK
jgi:5'-deoxynucleotidase YfbR-like HD superfamily hydrolase